MKAILSAALAFGLCGLAGARDDKADPVGTWKLEYNIGDMKREATLTIKKEGDKLVGHMDWSNQKDAKCKDLKFKDGELSYSADREVNDMKLTVNYKFKVEGDKLKGKGVLDVGGEKKDFEIEGKREKK
jgi:hypothetical protein